jgi:hypothetical protein
MFKQHLAVGTTTSDSPRRATIWQSVAPRVSPRRRPSVSLVDGTFGTSSLAVPSSSERTDLRSPWAARFDGQRGRLQAPRGPSRLRRLSRPRLFASPTSPRPSAAAPSPALAPGRSPMPSRLTSLPLRPCGRPTPAKRDRVDLRAAESQATDATRIEERTSATAIPGTCREGGSRSGTGDHHPGRAAVIGAMSSRRRAATPCGLTATAANNPPRSAGVGAAIPADVAALFAVDASNYTGASGTTATSFLTSPSCERNQHTHNHTYSQERGN